MIYLFCPYAIPSENEAYFNVRGSGRALSTKGRAFKTQLVTHWVKTYPLELASIKPNHPYSVFLRVYLHPVENAIWSATAKRASKKRATTRYRRIDATNFQKLAYDVLKDAMGIDDSNFLLAAVEKADGDRGIPPGTVGASLWIWERDDPEGPGAYFDDIQPPAR